MHNDKRFRTDKDVVAACDDVSFLTKINKDMSEIQKRRH